jgi:hypothetical protein
VSEIQTNPHAGAIIQHAVEVEAETIDAMRRTGELLNEAFEACPRGQWHETLRANGWTKTIRWSDYLRAVASNWERLTETGFDPAEHTFPEIKQEIARLSAGSKTTCAKNETEFAFEDDSKESAKEGEKSTVAATPTRGPDTQAAGAGGNGRAKLGGGVHAQVAKGVGAGIAGRPASPAAKTRPASDVIDTKVWQRENAAYRIVERLKVTLSTMEADFTKLFAEAEGADVRGRLMRILDNKDIVAFLADVRTVVKLYGPQWPCPLPHKGASCSQCKNRGYVNEEQYKALPPELMRRLGGKTK